jgi:hypothetical protein
MPKKSALQKIEHHERICRYMQKQTFERIDRMEARIARMEKFIICGLGAQKNTNTFITIEKLKNQVGLIWLVTKNYQVLQQY